MKTPWIGIIGLAFLAITTAHSQAPSGSPGEGNRFLFIVETSAAASKLEHGGRQAVFDLIFTGIAGQMKAGDTFGLWTFNDKVSAGVFPMQEWDPENNMELATQAGQYLKAQKYQNKARLDVAVKQLMPVVRAVKDLNIFIVSDPGTRLPDDPLGQGYGPENSKLAARARLAKQPLVTTLIVRNGGISNTLVTVGSEPIRLPALAIARSTVAASPRALATAKVRPTRAPIIMKGSQTPPSPQLGRVLSGSAEVNFVRSTQTNATPATPAGPAAPAPTDPAPDSASLQSPTPVVASTLPAPSPIPAPSLVEAKPNVAAAADVQKSETPQEIKTAPSAAVLAPIKVAARERSTTTPPRNEAKPVQAMAATAAPTLTERLFSPAAMVSIGALLFLLATAVTMLFVQKFRRPTHHASFITQSLEQ
jgi:hypothetical protein